MLGGYQIIDLSGMSVSLGSDVSISDPNVLKQLLALREHIEDNYDYSKPLNKKLKPVMIRLRDKDSGEKIESASWGNLSIVDDNLSFNIDAIVTANPLKVLQINVVFEKKQDDDGNDYYDIKSAKYEFKGGNDVVTVTNIKNIPSATINKLDCGDIVLKKDSSGYHAYIVSFRNATGICLTYTDASGIETQSYDKVGQNWVYNSEDKTPNLLEEVAVKSDIKPIYCHPISIIDGTLKIRIAMLIFNNDATPFTLETLKTYLDNLYAQVGDTIRIVTTGAYDNNGSSSIATYMGADSTGYYISGLAVGNMTASTLKKADWEELFPSSSVLNDGVNRIN